MLLELFAYIAQLFPQIYLCSAHGSHVEFHYIHVPNVIWPPEFTIMLALWLTVSCAG